MKFSRGGPAKIPSAANPVTDQAAEWLATLSDESCDPLERRRFARWLARSNTHIDECLRISVLTRRLQRRGAWPEVDMEALLAEARAAATVIELPRSGGSSPADQPSGGEAVPASADVSSPPRTFGRPAWAAAALISIAAAALLAIKMPVWLEGRHTYASAMGELRSVVLEDGSIVQLNSQSRVHTRFTAQERRVDLTAGEAVFKVTKDPARPFKVSTAYAEVVAVGTQFNVRSQDSETIVTVIEGRVAVSVPTAPATGEAKDERAPHTQAFLAAGEQAVIQPRLAIAKIARVDAAKVTGWTQRRLYFDDTPLSAVASEFSRYSSDVIRIEDPALGERRISGTFDSSDPGALVRFLQRYGDTTVVKTRQGWVLDRPSAEQKK